MNIERNITKLNIYTLSIITVTLFSFFVVVVVVPNEGIVVVAFYFYSQINRRVIRFRFSSVAHKTHEKSGRFFLFNE